MVGLWPARRRGDDVEVLRAGADGTPQVVATLHTLRQQRERSGEYLALADFVAEQGDHMGAFAVAIHGAEELAARYEAARDDYTAILVKAVADRLAEAFAEWAHREVRTRLWGYAPDEDVPWPTSSASATRASGPAPGYPAQPDHTEKATLDALLDLAEIGMALTESYAMTPASAVSGLYLAHPEARYLAVGRLARDQVADYAERKGWTLAEAEHWLAPNLGYDPAELIELIDWTPLFTSWELRGSYPQILDDPRQGEQARSLLADARALLDQVVDDGSLRAEGVLGLWPARRRGDDVDVLREGPDGTPQVVTTLHTLRQQRERSGEYLALADFVAEQGDHLGAFAVAVHGAEELAARYEAAHDDYTAILVKAVADRLAEAFAEWAHREVRTRLWGYAPDEQVPLADLIRERYQGIRPAPGYPAQPDHTEKAALDALLDLADVGVELTESFAMTPASAVSGLYLAHPDARYLAVGRIARDQVADYADRKGWTLAEAERWLAPNLGYDPD